MKLAGIICEYNPFHKMHALHIAQTREKTGVDYVICAMSGPFVQRGDLSICDKWTRAKMALLGGADAVFELPALFSLRAAPDFARGGVTLLAALGVDVLSFGSECDDLETLRQASRLDADPAEGLRKGQSYPRSLGEASGDWEALMRLPNFTLGVEYLRAIRDHAPKMEACVIRRYGAHDGTALGPHASAGAIRSALYEGRREQALSALSENAAALLKDPPLRLEDLSQAVLYALRALGPQGLKQIVGMREGLENRIYEGALRCATLSDLFVFVKCKRYTMAAIRRAVCAAALGMTQEVAHETPAVPYARLLGFSDRARPLMAQLKRQSAIPIYTKTASAPPSPCLELDLRAQDLQALAAGKVPRQDLTTSPVIVRTPGA